jgi:hypothetical protein
LSSCETHQPQVLVVMGFAIGSGRRPDPMVLPILQAVCAEQRSKRLKKYFSVIIYKPAGGDIETAVLVPRIYGLIEAIIEWIKESF